MHIRLVTLVTALVMIAPLVVASEGPPAQPGLPRACDRSGNAHVCRNVIPDTVIPPGQTKVYTGYWKAVGTVTVSGTAIVVDANITFEDTSDGFVAAPGGTIEVLSSDLLAVNGSTFGIDALPGTNLTVNDSSILGGGGVSVATSSVSFFENHLAGIPLALRLTDVTAVIHDNEFVNNTIAVNQTGGVPTLQANTFRGGQICVKDWRTDPNILYNTFRGCHIGIYHQESHSVFVGNNMQDEMEPPGAGMWIVDGMSPTIEDNVIRNYGTGIRISNARAYVRNNTIENNLGAGILVEQNPAEMDIQGNLVRLNGGDGIRLVGATDVPVFNNLVEDNGGDGIAIVNSPSASLTGNTARRNAGAGYGLYGSVDASLDANVAEANAVGFLVDAASVRADLVDDAATANLAAGILVRADDTLIEGGVANANGGDGLVLDHALDVVVTDLVANGNVDDGVFLGGSHATITGVNASENGGNGFRYDPMGPLQLLAPTPLNFVRAMHNGGAGLLNVAGNTTSVHDGWWQGNEGAGVENADPLSLIDASECYWGAASGPTHALNPLGTGDEVVGGVVYHPFLAAPPAG